MLPTRIFDLIDYIFAHCHVGTPAMAFHLNIGHWNKTFTLSYDEFYKSCNKQTFSLRSSFLPSEDREESYHIKISGPEHIQEYYTTILLTFLMWNKVSKNVDKDFCQKDFFRSNVFTIYNTFIDPCHYIFPIVSVFSLKSILSDECNFNYTTMKLWLFYHSNIALYSK